MSEKLSAKVALITGAARRVGAQIAHLLHEAGMNIVLHYHASEEEALKISEKMNQQRSHSAIVVRADLQDPESAKILMTQTAKQWGRLDVLVNNASRFYRTSLGKVTDYAWDDLMKCNLKAPFFLSQAAAPLLASTQGSIVNITDIHAEHPLKDYAVYCLSKGALALMTKVLAKELGPLVRVNAVAPGAVIWPEGENQLTDQEKQKIIDRTALKRAGSPLDIAKAVLYLVRDADYMTGTVLTVDGGRLLFG